GLGEGVGRLHRKARAVKARVEGHVADRHRARRRVHDHLPELEILEVVAGVGLGRSHGLVRSSYGRAGPISPKWLPLSTDFSPLAAPRALRTTPPAPCASPRCRPRWPRCAGP